MSKRTTRRGFIGGVAGAGAAVAVGGTAAPARAGDNGALRPDPNYPRPDAIYPNPDRPWGDPFKEPKGGRLARVISDRALEVVDGRGARVVQVGPDASIYTDREAALTDFVPGEMLAIEGVDTADGFQATAVWCDLGRVLTRIEVRRGDVLETRHGRMRLTSRTVYAPWKDPDAKVTEGDLRPGANILAKLRITPRNEPLAYIVKLLEK